MAAAKVPVLGQRAEQDGRQSAASRGSLSPSLSGWGSISASAEPDVSGLEANGAGAGDRQPKRRAAPPAKAATGKDRVQRHGQPTSREHRSSRGAAPEGQALGQPQAIAEGTHLCLTDEPHERRDVVDESAEQERRARRHKKELRLAQQRRGRRLSSRPAATIPSPRVGLCVAATEDPDAAPVRSSRPSAVGSAVTKKGPPHVLWVDRCTGLAQGMSKGVSTTHSALGRAGLVVRSYTDQRAALSWAKHHSSQVACAVLHVQLADCKQADQDLIEKCAGLQIPTVILQLVPPGFTPSRAVSAAMEKRAALCRKFGVPVASELNKAQATVLEEVSHKYEFGRSGQLQRLPTPKENMPPWKQPRTDSTDKMPPVNGAASANLVHRPNPYPGARRGNKNHYHLAPSNQGAGMVREYGRVGLCCFECAHTPLVCRCVQVQYSYAEFRSVNLRHEQKGTRPPQARHEGAQMTVKHNRGEPSWPKPPASQAAQSLRVGAMRVALPSHASESVPLLTPRTNEEVASSRRRLYASVNTAVGSIDGATMRDLRSRFALPPVAPQPRSNKPAS